VTNSLETSPDRRMLLTRAATAMFAGAAVGAGVAPVAAEAHIWRPEGASTLGRLGVLTPHFDPVAETAMTAMAPAGITIHAARAELIRISLEDRICLRDRLQRERTSEGGDDARGILIGH